MEHSETTTGPTPRILFLVLATINEPWKSVEKHQREYLSTVSENSANIDWIYYVDSPSDKASGLQNWFLNLNIRVRNFLNTFPSLTERGFRLRKSSTLNIFLRKLVTGGVFLREKKTLISIFPPQYWTLSIRTIEALRFVQSSNMEFDFIVRLNSTTLFRPSALIQFAQFQNNLIPWAAGAKAMFGKQPFLNGAAIVMNRLAFEALLANQYLFRLDLPDDVALSIVLDKSGVIFLDCAIDDFSNSTLDEPTLEKLRPESLFMRLRHNDPAMLEANVKRMSQVLRSE